MIRNNLHHYTEIESYQFITFRTQESIDPYLRKLSKTVDINVSEKQMKIDAYCDQSNKGCYLNGKVANLTMSYLKSLEPEYYLLTAVSIMPNHIHLLIQQKQELPIVMQKIKGATSHQINNLLARKGHFWEKSYFDKTIRDEKHFNVVYQYIKNNAYKANLKDADLRFYGIYQ